MPPLQKRRTLIIAPHADDEIFGCGGTLFRLLDDGCDVCVVVAATGDTHFQHLGRTVSQTERVAEFETVMKHCGVTKFGLLEPCGVDGSLDVMPIKDLVQAIENVQKKFGAEQWFIPAASFHQDHEVVCKAAIAAARPTNSSGPRSVFKYELPTYMWNEPHMQFNPTLFVDVGMSLDRKIAAVNKYETQLRPKDNLLSPDRLRDWARVRGFYAGVEFAEAFEVVKAVW